MTKQWGHQIYLTGKFSFNFFRSNNNDYNNNDDDDDDGKLRGYEQSKVFEAVTDPCLFCLKTPGVCTW